MNLSRGAILKKSGRKAGFTAEARRRGEVEGKRMEDTGLKFFLGLFESSWLNQKGTFNKVFKQIKTHPKNLNFRAFRVFRGVLRSASCFAYLSGQILFRTLRLCGDYSFTVPGEYFYFPPLFLIRSVNPSMSDCISSSSVNIL
jgi:hypothetical protein